MNYIYFYPEFVRILVCILIIAGICMQCFAFIYKFNSGAKGFKYVCELSFEFSVILLQFIYGYIYSCIYYQTCISIYYPEQYLAVGYIASILFFNYAYCNCCLFKASTHNIINMLCSAIAAICKLSCKRYIYSCSFYCTDNVYYKKCTFNIKSK